MSKPDSVQYTCPRCGYSMPVPLAIADAITAAAADGRSVPIPCRFRLVTREGWPVVCRGSCVRVGEDVGVHA